jgi:hypothetical protein
MAVEISAIAAAAGKAIVAAAETALEGLAHVGTELGIEGMPASVDPGAAAGQGAEAGGNGAVPSGAEAGARSVGQGARYDADTLWGRSADLPYGTDARADFEMPQAENATAAPKTPTARATAAPEPAAETPAKSETPSRRADAVQRQTHEAARKEQQDRKTPPERADAHRNASEAEASNVRQSPEDRAETARDQHSEMESEDEGPPIFWDDLSREERDMIEAETVRMMLEEIERIGRQPVIGIDGRVMTQAEYDMLIEREYNLLKLDTMGAIAQSPLAAGVVLAAGLATDDEIVLNQLANQAAEIESGVSGRSGGRRKPAARRRGRLGKRTIVRGYLQLLRRRRSMIGDPPSLRHHRRRFKNPFTDEAPGGASPYDAGVAGGTVRPLKLGAHRRYGLTPKGIAALMEAAYMFTRASAEIELGNPRAKKGDTSTLAHDSAQQFMSDLNAGRTKVSAEPRLSWLDKTRGDLRVQFPDLDMVVDFKRTVWVDHDGRPVNHLGQINPNQIQSLEAMARYNNTKVFLIGSDGRIFGYHPPSMRWEQVN